MLEPKLKSRLKSTLRSTDKILLPTCQEAPIASEVEGVY